MLLEFTFKYKKWSKLSKNYYHTWCSKCKTWSCFFPSWSILDLQPLQGCCMKTFDLNQLTRFSVQLSKQYTIPSISTSYKYPLQIEVFHCSEIYSTAGALQPSIILIPSMITHKSVINYQMSWSAYWRWMDQNEGHLFGNKSRQWLSTIWVFGYGSILKMHIQKNNWNISK